MSMAFSDTIKASDSLEQWAHHILGSSGPIAQRLPNYESRSEQNAMMQHVLSAMQKNEIALIEAGTGTGKSLAYLIPACLIALKRKERTVISTNTISLQEQLLNKDIPLLLKTCGWELKASLVKGMNNYLCKRKLLEAQSELRLMSPEESHEFDIISSWAEQTDDGTPSSLPIVPSHSTWERVRADSHACTGKACKHYDKCFFFKARQQSYLSQILIVNHHLLFADISARYSADKHDGTCILPPYKNIVIDEGHNIEDIATKYFASKFSRSELNKLMSQLGSEKNPSGKLENLKRQLHNTYDINQYDVFQSFHQKLTIDLPAERRRLIHTIAEAFDALSGFQKAQTLHSKQPKDKENKLRLYNKHYKSQNWNTGVAEKLSQLANQLKSLSIDISNLTTSITSSPLEDFIRKSESLRIDLNAVASRLLEYSMTVDQFCKENIPNNTVRWIESQSSQKRSNESAIDARLDISDILAQQLFSRFSSVVICSATLTTHNGFSFIKQRLGLTQKQLPDRNISELSYPSPFDYTKQALVAVHNDLPPPTQPEFTKLAAEKIIKILKVSQGNAFVLFTSYSMLQECYELIKPHIDEKKIPIFKQGDDDRHSLLSKFKQTNGSVILGTDSFWEGVDVAGDALHCVIIVKLPFRVPDEPITQARSELIQSEGKSPFIEYALPSAIMKFKQGFGRLIRHRNDQGCVICLDSRIASKNYGKLFLNSLPPCNIFINKTDNILKKLRSFYYRKQDTCKVKFY